MSNILLNFFDFFPILHSLIVVLNKKYYYLITLTFITEKEKRKKLLHIDVMKKPESVSEY